ncbi:aminoacyl-tRNA hydrolase [Candidatus Steffania adelgidicola]|uniref:aminoacyl-tRNA hydrolase n=1 Tax=Candidatus Steffania adelgidicola TaxID=1076626 RepID=UPI001D00BE39|nr:aminoacyl-tRNA hydrolase [Candidatus Steffania adelgidicola]UDG79585.1 Peptidyl-tRNA hydrolase [Candidatus Steffania adelgidicola]
MTIKLIVGLANPSGEYSATRHNAGAWYVEVLAARYDQTLKEERKFYGYTGCFTLEDKDIRLLVPTTFMNLSGKAVTVMARFYHIDPKEILLAHDELDLLPGYARLKGAGSKSSHNGVKNIISCFSKNTFFQRLCIGIGHPGDRNKVAGFVLGKPSIVEQQLINAAIEESVNCTEILITQNSLKAMNRLHTYRPM